MPGLFVFDRSWLFPFAAEDLWARLEQVEEYRTWWPWLKRFDARPPALRPGAHARCVAKPPVMPVAMRFTIDIVDVVPARLLAITVDGDLVGSASLVLTPLDGTATYGRVRWDVDLLHRALGPLSRFTRALAPRGQEWVVSTSLEHFRRGALGEP